MSSFKTPGKFNIFTQGCTKAMNYFKLGNRSEQRFIVDSPGYGYLGMKKISGDKLKTMIAKYLKESSR